MSLVNSFPNPIAPDTEKRTQEYGMKFMKAVFTSWTEGSIYGESRASRKVRFDYNRSYAMGRQDMSEFLDILDVDGGLSVINLAYDSLPIAIPFLNRMKDRQMSRVEKIVCNAIDPFTQEKKKTKRDNAVFKLHEGPRIAALQEASGVNIEDFKEEDPTSENEIDIEFGFNHKELEEVVMENGIELVFYENGWDEVIKDRIFDENANCGYAPLYVDFDANGRIKIRPVRPENFVSSSSEWNDFRDWQYQGESYYMSIMDIRRMYPGKISEQKLWELAKSQIGRNNNPSSMDYGWDYNFSNAPSRPYDQFRVEVLRVFLKTIDGLLYEQSEDRFGKTVLDRKKEKVDGKEYVESKPYEVMYEGIWITDTNYLLKWGLAENMIKPENNLQEIYSPYVVYMHNNTKMGNTPLMETMIPSIKIMQLTWLQQQKIIAAAAPDGYDIDVSYASDITLGTDLKNLTPVELHKIYKQTGIRYWKSMSDDGEERRQIPIQPNNFPFSAKLEGLMDVWNREYDKLQRIVGDNNLASGNITNQATGKEVLKNAREISESASNYLYGAYLNCAKRCARLVQLRLWDILIYGKKQGITYYEGYKKALGTDKVENLRIQSTDDMDKCAFDIMIQVVTDDAAQAQLNADINMALSQKMIEFHDAVDIRLVAQTDLKYAAFLMAARIRKRKKEEEEKAEKNSQMAMQGNAQAAKSKFDGEVALEDKKHTNKMAEQRQQQDDGLLMEQTKFFGILKSDVAKSILSKDGASIKDVPTWVFEGLPMDKMLSHELSMAYLQTIGQQAGQPPEGQQQQGQPGHPQQQNPNQQPAPPQQNQPAAA